MNNNKIFCCKCLYYPRAWPRVVLENGCYACDYIGDTWEKSEDSTLVDVPMNVLNAANNCSYFRKHNWFNLFFRYQRKPKY